MITLYDLRQNQSEELILKLTQHYNQPLNIISFSEQDIRKCIGCWDCWLKTPGICVMKDPMSEHYHDYVNSEKVILLFDTAQGFLNHQAKAFLDRTIPHYHPYIELVNGECHHKARYDQYPDMVFYFDTHDLSAVEEQVIEDYCYRTAFHFKSKAFRVLNDEEVKVALLAFREAKKGQVENGRTEPMEKLVIYHGSLRQKSNTTIMLNRLKEVLGNKVEIRCLKESQQWESWAESFQTDKHVMFFMPLYVHAMPSHVKRFMEMLTTSDGTISFFIQSGFPESSQSYYLQAHFEQLSKRLGRLYLGTAIKGGMEGLQSRPPQGQISMLNPIVATIEQLIETGAFNEELINKLAMPIRFSKPIALAFNLFAYKFLDAFWNSFLKSNQAFDKRFDQPYKATSKS